MPEINEVDLSDLKASLALGWQDFRRAPLLGMAFSAVYVLGGWLVFNHLPDQWTFMGMGLVALCGALGAWLTLRENRVAIPPAQS